MTRSLPLNENPYSPPRAEGPHTEIPSFRPTSDPMYGLWRQGNLLVMHLRHPLPEWCVKTNRPADGWALCNLSWHPPWVYKTAFFPPLYGILRQHLSKTAAINIGLCRELQVRGFQLVIAMLAVAALCLFLGCTGLAFLIAHSLWGWLFILIGVVAFMAIEFAFLSAYDEGHLRAAYLTDTHAWLKGVHPDYLLRFPVWPGTDFKLPPENWGGQSEISNPTEGSPSLNAPRLSDLNIAIELSPNDARLWIDRGHAYIQRGEYDLAVSDFCRAMSLDPSSADALAGRADANGKLGNLDLATEDYRAALALQPANSRIWLGRGLLWEYLGELERAIADYDEAIRLDPGFVQALVNRADVRYSLDRIDEAIADHNQLLLLNPDDAYALQCRGVAWHAKGELALAVADFDRALQLEPNESHTLFSRGCAWYELGDFERALVDLNKSSRLAPESAPTFYYRGATWAQLNKFDRALADFNEALRLQPGYADAFRERGSLGEQIQDYAQALSDYAEAIRIDSGNHRNWYRRGWLLAVCPDAQYRCGSLAVADATRACELSQWKDPPSLSGLAAACSEIGDFEAAVKWESRAIELLPSNDDELHSTQQRLAHYYLRKPVRELLISESPR